MCRSRYRKVKSLFEGTGTCGVTSRSVSTQTESVCVSTETRVETNITRNTHQEQKVN